MPEEQTPNRELAAFLRTRRERLQPADVGLPRRSQGRVQGLRREEVASLAGIGLTWYTLLESGKRISVSRKLLLRLAHALKLDDVERDTLIALVRPIGGSDDARADDAGFQGVVDGYVVAPAFVIGPRFDVLYFNRLTTLVYGYDSNSTTERNVLRRLFLDPSRRELHVDWEISARTATSLFRANYAEHQGEPDFENLRQELFDQCDEFRHFWAGFDVAPLPEFELRLQHPVVGRLEFDQRWFAVPNSRGLYLRIHLPKDGSACRQSLKLLADADSR